MKRAIDDFFEEDLILREDIIFNTMTDIYATMWPKETQRSYVKTAEEILKKHPELSYPLYLDRIETFKQNYL